MFEGERPLTCADQRQRRPGGQGRLHSCTELIRAWFQCLTFSEIKIGHLTLLEQEDFTPKPV
jgi:hypothetical protein